MTRALNRKIKIVLLALCCLNLWPRPAQAQVCTGTCVQTVLDQAELSGYYAAVEAANVLEFTLQFTVYADPTTFAYWLDNTFYGQYLGPTLQSMATQLTSLGLQQTLAIGTFFDATNQNETQSLFQELTARAHKDYQPSIGMCVFGTDMRSIAAADSNTNLTMRGMSQQAQRRELQTADGVASGSSTSDRASRLAQFAGRYCDRFDNNANASNNKTGLGKICTTAPTAPTLNKDIDYMRTLLLPRTLDLDFSDNTVHGDAEDVIAMSHNLYAHHLFDLGGVSSTVWSIAANRPTYLDIRAVTAKRSVAESSFNAIAAMKGSGTAVAGDTAKYMGVLLGELGMKPTDISNFLGSRPSYLAQLEVLAKKIYQRPEFYTELYESPANVARRGVAMQAIGNMLDRDIYNSQLRAESILSLLLEARLQPLQDKVALAASHLPQDAPR